MIELTEETFVLKDGYGNYVGHNSITRDGRTNNYIYSYSPFLTNGFYTYPDKKSAFLALELLEQLATKIKIAMKFHVMEVNRMEILTKESKMKIGKDPFVNIPLNVGGVAII